MAEWIFKMVQLCAIYKRFTSALRIYRLKEMGKDSLCKWKQTKQAEVAILTLDKIDFKSKTILRDKKIIL